MGECAAHEFLKQEGFIPSREPDFEIYKSKKKSWLSDMECNGVPVHIKSQEMWSAKKYGYSWMFQLSSSRPDGEDYDVLLKTPDGVVIFCTVGEDVVEIKALSTNRFKNLPAGGYEEHISQLNFYLKQQGKSSGYLFYVNMADRGQTKMI